jgi:ABC-type nitrate/sulfonate/bicarbonate transport system permease component
MVSKRCIDPAPLVLTAIILFAWEVGPRYAGTGNFPRFSSVMAVFWQNADTIAIQSLETLKRASIGFSIALLTMTPLGIIIGRSRALSIFLEPLIELFRPLPPLALVPIVMLFAGIGDGAKISVIAYAASFPILIHAIDGVRGIHPMYTQVSRSLRLTRLEQLTQIDLPAIMPLLVTGIRLAVSTAVLVAVTTEMLMSTNGIGLYILNAQQRFETSAGFAGIVVVAVLGWILSRIILKLDHRLLRWHYATTGDDSGRFK